MVATADIPQTQSSRLMQQKVFFLKSFRCNIDLQSDYNLIAVPNTDSFHLQTLRLQAHAHRGVSPNEICEAYFQGNMDGTEPHSYAYSWSHFRWWDEACLQEDHTDGA